MKNKSLSLVVGLLALGFYPSFSHAGSLNLEVGALGGYVLEVPTDIYVENPPADFSFDFNAEPDSAAFLSAYGFLGLDLFDFTLASGALEVMAIYNLRDEAFIDRDYSGLLDDPKLEPKFLFENAYGGGARVSLGFSALEAFARGGYAKFSYVVAQGRITRVSRVDRSGFLEIRRAEDLRYSNWGLYLGAGIRAGILTFGYYYLPDMEEAHVLTIGLQF